MSIIKNVSDIPNSKPHIIITTKIPWKVHHPNTVILGSAFNGHVVLKIKNNMYYLGDATGLSPPIMLGHLYKVKSKKIQEVHTSEVVAVVIRRLQDRKTDIPDVQPTTYEKIARSVIWSLVLKNNMMDKWISLEKDRVKLLLENYTFDNVLLVYPMVKSKNNAINDVENSYLNGEIIPMILPSYEVFHWVIDILSEY